MENWPQLCAAVGFTAAGAALALYEWSRSISGRPLFKGRGAIDLYSMVYLTLLVLGLTFLVAAVVR